MGLDREPYEEWLRLLGLFSLEETSLWSTSSSCGEAEEQVPMSSLL